MVFSTVLTRVGLPQVGQARVPIQADPDRGDGRDVVLELDEMVAQIVGISFSVKPGEAAYIPLKHTGPDAPAQLPFAVAGPEFG